MVSKGQFVGLDWNRITQLHSQVMTGTQEVTNSLTASCCHLKAYPRCDQPTSKVSILKMKQQQHDVNLRRNRKKKIRVPDGIALGPCSPQSLQQLNWLEHSTRSRRVLGSNPIWDSDFFLRFLLKLISCCCCFIFNILCNYEVI